MIFNMRIRSNIYAKRELNKKRSIAYGILICAALIFLIISFYSFLGDKPDEIPPPTLSMPPVFSPAPSPQIAAKMQTDTDDKENDLWDGPVLYYAGENEPIHLILVEKELQKLHLYRYDGRYRKIKSYRCVTGKQRGDKRRENDDRTPEGIYFNVKTYRDNKITLFGDRAFGLGYPDIYDDFAGNGGSGIFIHGSNRDITPFSTNGCLVLDNKDLADLDKRIQFRTTPIIIGKRLPYGFTEAKRDLKEVIPLLKQALLPKKYAGADSMFRYLTILGFQEQIVAVGSVLIKEPNNIEGFSRLYLSDPGKNLLVLLKREWSEKKLLRVASAKPKPRPVSAEAKEISSLVESWRKAWEQKRLDEYISHYHPAFISSGKSLTAWKGYKNRLNNRYRRISVKVSNLRIKDNGSKAWAYFEQGYDTESYHAKGYKRLEFRKKDGSWKIFRERSYPAKPKRWPS